ncbi:hypothetical protein H4Q26_015040 [Puccinia striiformis f. sp. tritici PST-130]|nr:hypothetical protein H4Q26_015040 [Puccinia striiformis f. sp. tritici PST-130]
MIPAPCGHSWVTRFNGSRPSCGMLKRPLTKYQSPPTVNLLNWTWPGKTINQVPRWCAVDLRDGNQSLETEVGFPVASDTNFNFVRKIPKSRQPNLDNVLLPAREDLIWSTFDAVQDGKNMIIHMYHTTSPLLCQKVFQASKAKTIDLAVQHTELKPSLEPKFSVKICEAVKKAWFHGKDMKKSPPIIFNLPATVEVSTPNSPFHQNPADGKTQINPTTGKPLPLRKLLKASILKDKKPVELSGEGNVPVSAMMNAMRTHCGLMLDVVSYSKKAIGSGSETKAS